jgi:hypothetical protein
LLEVPVRSFYAVIAAIVIVFVNGPSEAQTNPPSPPVRGGVTKGDYPKYSGGLDPHRFPNEDPKTTAPYFGENGGPNKFQPCTFPLNVDTSKFRLLEQRGKYCLWAAPLNPKYAQMIATWKIVLAKEVTSSAVWRRCEEDPWDAAKLVCDEPPWVPPVRTAVCADGTNGGGPDSTNYYGSCGTDVRMPSVPPSYPQRGGVNGNGGRSYPPTSGDGNPSGPRTPGGTGPSCPADPDWVRTYKAQGADPPLRYKTGFYQGVAGCLQDQCTIQNLAIAVSAAAFGRVRAVLAVATVPTLIDAVVRPPGFSPDPDLYVKGKDEGSRLCNWLLKLSVAANARGPLVGPGGKITIPPGFNFYKALKSIPEWLPKINPTACGRNCGQATVNSVRVMFGRPLDPAPSTTRGMTDGQMEAALGTKFSGMPLTDVDMFTFLSRMPEGTVAVISGENPNATGTPPPSGPITNWNDIPGHFFWVVKGNGQLQMWSGQSGGPQMALPGDWVYRWTIVGNALRP